MDVLTSFKPKACQSGTPAGEAEVAIPVRFAASKLPESATRINRSKGWVAAVLSVDGANYIGWIRGTWRVSGVRDSAFISATKSEWNLEGVEALEAWGKLSSYRKQSLAGEGVVVGAGASGVSTAGVTVVAGTTKGRHHKAKEVVNHSLDTQGSGHH